MGHPDPADIAQLLEAHEAKSLLRFLLCGYFVCISDNQRVKVHIGLQAEPNQGQDNHEDDRDRRQ